MFSDAISDVLPHLNGILEDFSKLQLIVCSMSFTTVLMFAPSYFLNYKETWKSIKHRAFMTIRKIPRVHNEIEKRLTEARKDIDESVHGELKASDYLSKLNSEGKTADETYKLIASQLGGSEFEWKNGRISGGIFSGDDEDYNKLMIQLYSMFPWDNPLHADIFPGIRKMEAEIVRMTATLFNGDNDVTGTMTCGGSESLLMMMKAYRDFGRHERGIRNPEIIASKNFHAALNKGGDLFGIKVIQIDPDPKTKQLGVHHVKKYITSNTIAIAASCPDYSYGIIDDIIGLGAFAEKKGIPLHVDCCLGGFVLPFMQEAGFPLPKFDFRVPGVTSISADTHKYGSAPKGTSVILYRDKKYAHHQYFVTPDWTGGIYATPTIPGSRPGCNIAMCWGALVSHGQKGYVDKTRKIIEAARYIKKEFSSVPEISLFGDPLGPVIAIRSDQLNIYQISDEMMSAGWHLQPLQNPPGLHVFLTSLHTQEGVPQKLVSDFHDAITRVRANPLPNAQKGLAKLYCMASTIPDATLLDDVAKMYLEASGDTRQDG